MKKKISLEALEDVWVRFQSDEKPSMMLLLRRGKFLVIKAKDKIIFDTNDVASLRYRTRSSAFEPLTLNQLTVENDGTIKPSPEGVTGTKKLPETTPSPSQP